MLKNLFIKGFTGNTYQVPRIDPVSFAIETIDYTHHKIHAGDHFYMVGHTELASAATLFVKLVTPNLGRWGHFIWDINSSGILATTFDEDATGGMADGLRETIHANNRNTDCWTGSHIGGSGEATILTDSTKSWAKNELVGYQVFNSTDSSSGIITANDATTVTVSALAGGTDNDWDTGDKYEINKSRFVITKGVSTCTSYTQRIDNVKFGSRQSGGVSGRIDELILKRNTVYCRSFTSGSANNLLHFKANWYELENEE